MSFCDLGQSCWWYRPPDAQRSATAPSQWLRHVRGTACCHLSWMHRRWRRSVANWRLYFLVVIRRWLGARDIKIVHGPVWTGHALCASCADTMASMRNGCTICRTHIVKVLCLFNWNSLCVLAWRLIIKRCCGLLRRMQSKLKLTNLCFIKNKILRCTHC